MNFINEIGNATDHRSQNTDTVNISKSVYPTNYVTGLTLDYDESALSYLTYLRQSADKYSEENAFIFPRTTNCRTFILKPFDVGTNTWSIESSFKSNILNAYQSIYNHYNASFTPIRLQISNTGYMQLTLSATSLNDIANVLGTTFIGVNRKVWTKLYFTGTQYLLDISFDGINYVNDISITSSTPISSPAGNAYSFALGMIGSVSAPILGNIYNEDFKIRIGDDYLINGIYLHRIKILNGRARGYLNKFNLDINNVTYKDININISDDKIKGSYIQYNNHNKLNSLTIYSIFVVGNGIDNNIICIHNSAHTYGILNSDAITVIKNQLSLNDLDYRYLGDVKTNHYFAPYLERYVKRIDGIEKNIDSSIDSSTYDGLSGYETNLLGIKKSWTRTGGATDYSLPPYSASTVYIDNYE